MHNILSKIAHVLIILAVCSKLADASQMFKDMPEKHWAEEAVYSLVRLGVTDGYPDGTFRGNEKVTRYQIAGFLNKLSQKIKGQPGIDKLVSELKTEVNTEKFRLENPPHPLFSGILRVNSSNFTADYRAKLFLKRNFNKYNGILLTLDTIDAGFNSAASREAANDMFEFAGRFRLSEIDFSLAFGAGDILHSDPLNPSATGKVFRQNKPEISGKITQGNADFSAGYTILNKFSNGLVAAEDTFIGIGYVFRPIPLFGKVKKSAFIHYSKAGNARDIRGELTATITPSTDISLRISAGAANKNTSGLYFGGELKINRLKFHLQRAGSSFRTAGINKYDFLPLNLFDKYITDGTCDTGIEFVQPIGQNVDFKFLADLVLSGDYKLGANYPGTSLTSEYNLALKLTERSKAALFYRHYYVPSGKNYADPAIAEVVPIHSNVIGLGLEAEL